MTISRPRSSERERVDFRLLVLLANARCYTIRANGRNIYLLNS